MAIEMYLGYPPENIRKWLEKIDQNHTVKFIYMDNSGVQNEFTVEVKHGESATPPIDVQTYKEEPFKITEFKSWDRPLDNVIEDMTVKPVYKDAETLDLEDLTVEETVEAEEINTDNLKIGTEE